MTESTPHHAAMPDPLSSLPPDDAALVARLDPALWQANGIPEPSLAASRERALAAVLSRLGDVVRLGDVRTSPLGVAWSSDLDVHLAVPIPLDRLIALEWIRATAIAPWLPAATNRYVVVEAGAILGAVDFNFGALRDPLSTVLDRARARREVRLREVLELRTLVRAGAALPVGDPIIEAASRAEAALGGSELARWRVAPPANPPIELEARTLRRLRRALRVLRGPRDVVAVSGVDGAGKSTLAGTLVDGLTRAGIPAERVWTRPGLRLRLLAGAAGFAKRLLREEPEPGIRRVALSERSSPPTSRRGIVGWTWSLLVTIAFLADVWNRHLRARGVLVYDRHRLDAIATLRFGYGGVDTRVHEAFVRRLLPPARSTIYLDVSQDVAVERKPGDTIGAFAVSQQLEAYRACLDSQEDVTVLDGTRPPNDLLLEALEVLAAPSRPRVARVRPDS